MAVALIATPKAPNANSYGTVAEAEAYFAGRLNATAWTALADEDKKARALITATSRLEQQRFDGWATTAEQALKFPRYGLTNDDFQPYDGDTIPVPLLHACFEEALALLQDETALDPSPLAGYDDIRLGPLAVTFRKPHPAGDLCPQAERLLVGIMLGSGGVEILRG